MSLGIALGAAAKSGLEAFRIVRDERRRQEQFGWERAKAEEEQAARDRANAERAAIGAIPAAGSEYVDVDMVDADGATRKFQMSPEGAGGFRKAWQDYYASQDRGGVAGEAEVAPGSGVVAPRVTIAPRGAINVSDPKVQTQSGQLRQWAEAIKGINPEKSAAYLTQADQMDATALQREAATRTNKREKALDDFMWLRQNESAATDPKHPEHERWWRMTTDLGTNGKDDGKKFEFIPQLQGPPLLKMTDAEGNETYRNAKPGQILDALEKYHPQLYASAKQREMEQTRMDRQEEQFNASMGQRDRQFAEQMRLQRDELASLDAWRRRMAQTKADGTRTLEAVIATPEGKEAWNIYKQAEQAYVAATANGDPRQIQTAKAILDNSLNRLNMLAGDQGRFLSAQGKDAARLTPEQAAYAKMIETDPNMSYEQKRIAMDELFGRDPVANAMGALPKKGKTPSTKEEIMDTLGPMIERRGRAPAPAPATQPETVAPAIQDYRNWQERSRGMPSSAPLYRVPPPPR